MQTRQRKRYVVQSPMCNEELVPDGLDYEKWLGPAPPSVPTVLSALPTTEHGLTMSIALVFWQDGEPIRLIS